jgi:hypothetical protein
VTCIRLEVVNNVWYIYVPWATQAVLIARCGPETVFRDKHGVWDPMPFCRFQSRLKHMYHGKPYGRVGLNPMHESTSSPSQGPRIRPQEVPASALLSCHPCPECIAAKRNARKNPENSALLDCCYNEQQRIVKLQYMLLLTEHKDSRSCFVNHVKQWVSILSKVPEHW